MNFYLAHKICSKNKFFQENNLTLFIRDNQFVNNKLIKAFSTETERKTKKLFCFPIDSLSIFSSFLIRHLETFGNSTR